MKIENLWIQIEIIYKNFNFSSKLMVNDLMIISQDNYYLCHYHSINKFSIRLEKEYSMSQMNYNYKAIIETSNNFNDHQIFDDVIPEKFIDIIKPILRNFQLDIILD